MADLKAISERWAAAVDGHISPDDVTTLDGARGRLAFAIEDIGALFAALEMKTEAHDEARRALAEMTFAHDAACRAVVSIDEEREQARQALTKERERVAELVEIENLLRTAGEVSAPDREDDVAFDRAWDAVASEAARLAGKPAPVAVSALTARLAESHCPGCEDPSRYAAQGCPGISAAGEVPRG